MNDNLVIYFQNLIWNSDETPVVFSQAIYRTPHNKTTWIKKFFVLKGTRLLMSADVSILMQWYKSIRCHTLMFMWK